MIKTDKNLKVKPKFFIDIILEVMRDTAEKMRAYEHGKYDVQIFHLINTRLIMSAPKYE